MDSLNLNSEKVLHNLGVKCVEGAANKENDSNVSYIQCVENWMFVYNPGDSSLVVTNLSQSPLTYQTFVPKEPLQFKVNSFKVNSTLTFCVFYGNSGLVVMDLPNTCGIGGNFAFGKENIICRCQTLDERYFVCQPSLAITQVKWIPHAYGDDQILVLTSKNELRLYSAASGALKSFYRVDDSATTLTSLGHVAIDFDFLPPNYKTDEDLLEFPLLVLFMDGEVHLVTLFVSKDDLLFSPQNHGCLPFVPQAEDNYGEDASSILIIPSSPPFVSIASATGTLYHCLLFENDQSEETWSGVGSVARKPFSLHVVEVVELKLGLPSDGQDERMFSSPVHLLGDVTVTSRYFCFHKLGVHVVRIPLIDQLNELAEAGETETSDAHLPQFSSSHCKIEHLIFIGTTDETPDLLGFTLLLLPRCLILLLGNGEYISVTLRSSVIQDALRDEFKEKLNIEDQRKHESYSSYVDGLLQQVNNIPLLKVDLNSSLTDEDIQDIYTKNMEILLRQVLPQLESVSQNMVLKKKSLRKLEKDLLNKIEECQKVQETCKETAEQLADKYEEINERHEQLMKKAQQILTNVYSKCNSNPREEQRFRTKLEGYKTKVDVLQKQLSEVKATEDKAKGLNDKEKRLSESFYLNPSKEKILKEVLFELQVTIRELNTRLLEAEDDVENIKMAQQNIV